jgi:heme/copper-type cytochrome/quinol oxidase subunit 3
MSRPPVTRSMQATASRDAARVALQRRAPPNGWWGMAVFLASEATLFGSLIASYFYLRFTSTEWPLGGIKAPSVALPIVMTGVLVLSTLPMAGASAAARRGRLRRTWLLILCALLIQAGYLTVQIIQYIDDLGTFTPSTNAYGSIYYTLLGTHHAHVLVGMLLDAWLLGRLLAGFTNYRVIAVRSVALYWYVVSAIAIFVVATQVSAS